MKISLCMIVRDEADRLADCLRSVEDLVEEIVVVDTGSQDDTREIARANGARLILSPWNDDFAAARNCALAQAAGDWVLVLDADERISPRHFEAIRRAAASPLPAAIQVFVRTYTDDSELLNWHPINPDRHEAMGFCGYFDTPQLRLFRRDDRIRFEGIVHETVAPSLEAHNLPVYRADIVIHHYKEARPAEQKAARNRLIFDLAKKRAEAEPDRADSWRNLALAALDIGENAEAVASLRRALELSPHRRDLYFQLGAILMLDGRPQEACTLYERAIERFPGEPELFQWYGEALIAAGRFDEAREALSRGLELDPYLYRALLGMGLVAAKAGEPDRALTYFERAKSISPESDYPYVNIGLVHLAEGRTDQALAELRRAFALNPRRRQTLAAIGEILFQSGLYEEAYDWLSRVASREDCPRQVYERLRACALELGREDEAEKWAAKIPQP